MLTDMGLTFDDISMKGIGYKELIPVLREGAPLDGAVELVKRRSRNYAKRQLTWFRADKRIRWLPADDGQFPDVQMLLSCLEEPVP